MTLLCNLFFIFVPAVLLKNHNHILSAMSTYQKILDDLKAAMKQKDQHRLDVLRSLKSAIFEKEVSERKDGKAELSEDDVVNVIMKAAKQRKDSIEQYNEAGRTDLADNEEKELQIIESYLPEMMSEDEITSIVEEAINNTGASGPQDMGKVMGQVMPKVKGKADGSVVNRIVKEKLTS